MIHFVYLTYGDKRILQQARLSILCLLHFAEGYGDFQILVFTDQPAAFDGLPVVIRELAPGEIDDWKGPGNFLHRPKVVMMKEVFEQYEGTVIYMDSDVLVFENPTDHFKHIDAGHSLMYYREGSIASGYNPTFKKIGKLIRTTTFDSPWEPELRIPLRTEMFNCGTIGFDTALRDLPEKVLWLTDELWSLLQKHTMEQFAWSYMISNQTKVHTLDEIAVHFWGFGKAAAPRIDMFLAEIGGLPLDRQFREAVRFSATYMRKYHDPYFIMPIRRKFRKNPLLLLRYGGKVPERMLIRQDVEEYELKK